MPSTVRAAASGSPPRSMRGVARELEQDRVGESVETARGKVAERAGDLLERPDLGDVGHGDGQRHATLEPAQRGRNGFGQRAVARRRPHGTKFACKIGQDGLGALPPQIGHKNRVL